MIIKIIEIAYHRNGVCGNGFHAVCFLCSEGKGWKRFIATVFDEPGNCAVLGINQLSDNENPVTFTINSFRGDRYEGTLRDEIKKWSDKRDEELEDLIASGGKPKTETVPMWPVYDSDIEAILIEYDWHPEFISETEAIPRKRIAGYVLDTIVRVDLQKVEDAAFQCENAADRKVAAHKALAAILRRKKIISKRKVKP